MNFSPMMNQFVKFIAHDNIVSVSLRLNAARKYFWIFFGKNIFVENNFGNLFFMYLFDIFSDQMRTDIFFLQD